MRRRHRRSLFVPRSDRYSGGSQHDGRRVQDRAKPLSSDFDPNVRYQFQRRTGDAILDAFISVTFSPRTSTARRRRDRPNVQERTRFFDFVSRLLIIHRSSTAPPQVVTTDLRSPVKFSAGPVDDLIFDIPAFSRWIDSILAKPQQPLLTRGRDSFAGYNTMAISLSIPIGLRQSQQCGGVSRLRFGTQPFWQISRPAQVEGGDRVLIAGNIITGRNAKRLIVRAIGPSLSSMAGCALRSHAQTRYPPGRFWPATIIGRTVLRPRKQPGVLASDPRESAIITVPGVSYGDR
jgi:hypothetical protein